MRKMGLLVLGLTAAAFVAGVHWGGAGSRGPAHADEAPAESAAPAREAIYTCSMHPQVRSPDPKSKCPICAMDLIPVPVHDDDAADDADAPRLRLSPRAAALMDIRTWPVERRGGEVDIALTGKIGIDERRVYDVVARTEAYIELLRVNTPWQAVAAGEPIAELYSPAVEGAFRELRVAQAGPAELREAAHARLRRLGVTKEQVEAVARDGNAPRTFRMTSPAAGLSVPPPEVREGEWVGEGARLVRIADLSKVWVNLEAYERDLAWLAVGQAVRFDVAARAGETFEGTIVFIEPVVNEPTRTVRIRVEADNPDGRLKPGMFVSARVRAAHPPSMKPSADGETPPRPLVVPDTAPLITGRRALVYVRVPDTDRPTFEARDVVLGPRAAGFYIVREGLAEGDLVVVNGQFKLDSELQIRGRPSMMSADRFDAAPAASRAAAGPRLQTHCPVMGGRISPEHFVDVEGVRIFVCCPGCDAAILEHPQKYLAKMKAEGVTPYRLQTLCPVMGGAINRTHYHDHDGWRIYVCCPGCLDEVRARADEIIREQRARGIVFEKAPASGAGGTHP